MLAPSEDFTSRTVLNISSVLDFITVFGVFGEAARGESAVGGVLVSVGGCFGFEDLEFGDFKSAVFELEVFEFEVFEFEVFESFDFETGCLEFGFFALDF